MDDNAILDLYFARAENAVSETAAKYGAYCYAIAYNILSSREDAEESVNDTYLAAWNSIPPKRPDMLSAFLGKITRCISLDRWKRFYAAKRGGGEVPLVLEELGECISGGENPEEELIRKEQLGCLNAFLEGLPKTERKVFVCRYWYMESIPEIADRFGFSRSKVSSMLHRTRGRLRLALEKEGF